MASPAPVAARAARAFAAPRSVTNGESARTRLGPRLFWPPDAASSPRPGPARARAAFSFSSPGSSRRALRRLGFFIEPFVVAAAAEGDGSSAFWDAGDDGPPPAHRGYAPVPGFGEYYVPPKPPKPEKSARDGARVAPDGAPLPPPPPPKRAPSKLLQEPAQAGIWERPERGTPNGAAPSSVQPRSFGDDLRAVRSDPPFSPGGLGEQAAPASVGVAVASVVPYDANATDQNANASDVSNDPELLRLRATYRLLTRMAGWLRYLFPVTGGLACWVAAGASLGGVFAKLVPQMVNVVNVLTFALAATLGASACLGAFLVVALVGRALRNALFGDWESSFDAASKPVEPYDYPTHPGLLAQARAQSEQEMRYRAAQMEQARANELRYEEYQRRYERSNAVSTDRRDGSGSGSASFSGSALVAADSYVDRWDGGSWDESDAYYPDASFDDVVGTLNRSRDFNAYEEEEEEEKEAFAARAPPKRKRVDLPIETLMGLGGETLSAVGSEWQTQRQREAASKGGGAAGAANEAAGGNRRNDGKETGAGAPAPPPPQRRQQPPPSQPAQARAAPAPTPAPAPAPAPAPVMRGGKVDWDPDALMRDMGYGAPAPPPRAGGARAGGAGEEKRRRLVRRFFRRRFWRRREEAPAPAPAPVTPPPLPSRRWTPCSRCWAAAARENPNAARAAAAAARAPSGDYYLSPTQEQSKEQFEEMQRRRDEWNNRVQRAVKRKDGGRGEGARGDGA